MKKKGGTAPGRLVDFGRKLSQPVDALPLGIFRSLFGFLLCLEFFVLSRETFVADYITPSFHFTYPLFNLLRLKAFPATYLWPLFYLLRASAVAIMLGLCTRLALITFTATYGYFFFSESSVYTNHYYLIFLVSFLLCFGHSGSIFSLDSLIRKKTYRDTVCFWEFYLLRFQICVVFLFGALAKMNADWLIQAAPLYLNFVRHFSLFGYPLHEKWLAFALSWGGMLSDLGLGLLLAFRRWQRLTFVWLCLFNGLNICLFGFGIKTFPYMMVSSFILFLPPSTLRGFYQKAFAQKAKPSKQVQKTTYSRPILAFVVCYISLQILIPFRHLLYKRDLRWTHEGIDFSWRMMGDHHETEGGITVEDPASGNIYLHSPENLLTRKQLVMVNNPYMLLQYLEFLKIYLKQQSGIQNPIIKADIQVSVNGRPFQPMYDPNSNLAQVTYSPFQDLNWIIPLKK